ncbi:peptidyl-alpha-hydroxyglycine alpha-amidating lyase 1-like isoform X1 [Teleopsis dalmanni]|uniref:peptidyl-alpha-hydroxyglycine alpha-amidating lyase 1-like isoform X1 n=1 Tax=Teleopsis dalmanni TaxID=139649 RepID=UPI0018CDFF47|nr:peptidyl-alpha-hydroxyglycine alpha-amidating lyase 1-like isoform X1 [Teleopsis dalmanni]
MLAGYTWFLFSVFCIITARTNEHPSPQRYLPLAPDEETRNVNKRFQQIMQGSSADVTWPQALKLKSEKINVKEEIAKLNTSYVHQSSWPETNIHLGSVTAVSFDKDGNVVIFHRVDRVWDQDTFDNANIFQQKRKGPIINSTVLAFDRQSGKLVYEWGRKLFYMPHGLTVDHENNVWVTDVALHQVFKFGPAGSNDKPLMILGTAFTPGNGNSKFCKPTSIAVLENGDFFVADGYCNARILKYAPNGEMINKWGQNSFAGDSYEFAPKNFFAIPHALTLVPEQELICTADRENGRVQCFFWVNGTFHSQYHNQIIGDRLFSMDYTPANGGQLVIVNGPTAELGMNPNHYNEVRGYIMNMKTKDVVSKFGPYNNSQFENPHDVAVTKDGNEIYVAELNPTRIHKFVHTTAANTASMSVSKKPTATTGVGPEYEIAKAAFKTTNATNENTTLPNKAGRHPSGTAILVASLMLLFTLFTFGLALLIARRRKRGCLPFGVKNRRHAWDFPAKSEGFKLGGLLLDRSKHNGFEKLNQNASDEENETTTTSILTSAQFA